MNTNKLFHEVLDKTPPEIKKQSDYGFRISNKIDARMKELNMTKDDLAKITGASNRSVTLWLSGQHNFTIKTLAKISVALDFDLIKI
jgi:DNA-binding XRE family transcriptional regulator